MCLVDFMCLLMLLKSLAEVLALVCDLGSVQNSREYIKYSHQTVFVSEGGLCRSELKLMGV